MIGDKKMPKAVRYAAYRNAVEASLVMFFDMSSDHAASTANHWWTRIAKTSAMKSGIFLHAEPVQTAARLLGVERPAMTDATRLIYGNLLRESMERAERNAGMTASRIRPRKLTEMEPQPDWRVMEPIQPRLKARA